jgi:predicted nucleic acid-binding protein
MRPQDDRSRDPTFSDQLHQNLDSKQLAPARSTLIRPIDLHRLHGLNFWDALIVRSAKQAGCSLLFSEDIEGQREFDGVQIVNPFVGSGKN